MLWLSHAGNSTETSKASREVVIMMMIMKTKGKEMCSFEGGSNNSVTSPLQVLKKT